MTQYSRCGPFFSIFIVFQFFVFNFEEFFVFPFSVFRNHINQRQYVASKTQSHAIASNIHTPLKYRQCIIWNPETCTTEINVELERPRPPPILPSPTRLFPPASIDVLYICLGLIRIGGLVVRLEGTNVDLGKKILEESDLNITAVTTMKEAATTVVGLI